MDGSTSDAAIFNRSEMKEVIENGIIGFPAADPLPNDDRSMPYFIIGDDDFPLRTWLMKPYSRRNLPDAERVFNYRLSRVGVVENAFGILSNIFRCLLTTMQQTPKVVESIGLACRCLHNFMRYFRMPPWIRRVLKYYHDYSGLTMIFFQQGQIWENART